jgi:hypothetical protein
LKQKILVVLDVEVDVGDGEGHCLPACPFYPDKDLPDVCQVFGDRLELAAVGSDGFHRSPRCLRAAGNHNILGKCLAGE